MGKCKQVIGKSHLPGKVVIQQVARVLVSLSLMKLIDTRLWCPLSQENLAQSVHAHLQFPRKVRAQLSNNILKLDGCRVNQIWPA